MQSNPCAIVGVLAMVLCGVGCSRQNEISTTNDLGGAAAASLDRVTAGLPIRKTLQLFTEQPGRVVAFEETPVLSKLTGYVDAVHVDIGDRVSKGQVLIDIFAPEYNDQLQQKLGLRKQAEAQITQAEAALVAARAAAKSAEALIVQAEAAIGRTDGEFERWESALQRMKQLASKESVTPKLVDETSSQFQAAAAARNEALANVESAKAKRNEADAKIQTAIADVEAAKARLTVAQADIAQAETMLAYTRLIAPFDGYVTSRQVDAGHYVQSAGSSGVKPLMSIASVDIVRIFVNVPENEAVWVDAGFDNSEAGDPVTIFSPSIPGGQIHTRVTRSNRQLDPQSRTLMVEIDVDNAQTKLLPGAFVTAKILLEQRDDVLTLPIAAITKEGARTWCCVVDNGKIVHRLIALGLRVGDEVEVKSGLDGTEIVVLTRAASLLEGQRVEVIDKSKDR